MENQNQRSNPLPGFGDVYPLTTAQIESYQRDGHLCLRRVATEDEVRMYRPFMKEAIRPVVEARDSQGRIDDYSNLFLQVTNVWRLSDAVKQFVFGRRFARIAAELMGVEGVRLYHDQILFKEPGGRPTPWHQDHYYWPLDTQHTITMWMPLVDVPKEMGPMIFASGSHREGLLENRPISDETNALFSELIAQKAFQTVSYELKAGDATFHSGFMLHSSHPNTTGRVREVITIIYFADGCRVLEPNNEHRKADMEAFLPSLKPGEVAASAMNPLLFKE